MSHLPLRQVHPDFHTGEDMPFSSADGGLTYTVPCFTLHGMVEIHVAE